MNVDGIKSDMTICSYNFTEEIVVKNSNLKIQFFGFPNKIIFYLFSRRYTVQNRLPDGNKIPTGTYF